MVVTVKKSGCTLYRLLLVFITAVALSPTLFAQECSEVFHQKIKSLNVIEALKLFNVVQVKTLSPEMVIAFFDGLAWEDSSSLKYLLAQAGVENLAWSARWFSFNTASHLKKHWSFPFKIKKTFYLAKLPRELTRENLGSYFYKLFRTLQSIAVNTALSAFRLRPEDYQAKAWELIGSSEFYAYNILALLNPDILPNVVYPPQQEHKLDRALIQQGHLPSYLSLNESRAIGSWLTSCEWGTQQAGTQPYGTEYVESELSDVQHSGAQVLQAQVGSGIIFHQVARMEQQLKRTCLLAFFAMALGPSLVHATLGLPQRVNEFLVVRTLQFDPKSYEAPFSQDELLQAREQMRLYWFQRLQQIEYEITKNQKSVQLQQERQRVLEQLKRQ